MTRRPPKTLQATTLEAAREVAAAPWRGRKRAPPDDLKDKRIALRLTVSDHATIDGKARAAGLSLGAYMRATALGSSGPRAVKRAPADRAAVARLLGELGKLGSNVNQLAKWANTQQTAPTAAQLGTMQADLAAMRAALMEALNRDY